jgi:NTP pyrophosphatase (non-canonical NTP hydrolase)
VTAPRKRGEVTTRTVSGVQQELDSWIRGHGGYWSALSQYVRLVEEVGELGRELNHRVGDKPRGTKDPPGSLTDEFGDLFFVLVLLANSLDVDLDAALTRTLKKYEMRR